MTRFRVDERDTGVAIELTEVGDKQAALLEAFQECQDGRCDCPTNEYQKVATMAVEPCQDRIKIRLSVKRGERFDGGQIERCLDHTIAKTE